MQDTQTQNTFQNLQVLQDARITAIELLGDRYFEVINPFRKIIEMVMKANNENHFEATKRIQEKTDLMDSLDKKVVFSSALMEIVDEKNLGDFEK